MHLTFDITDEELPIFQAEVSEQIQVLEEGLVLLEKAEQDVDLIQSLFRAAHTLKGSAGMIGHKRMVELTHALESALDGLRKNTIAITVELIDACLETVDVLRLVSDEVSTGMASEVEIAPLAGRLSAVASGKLAAASDQPSAPLHPPPPLPAPRTPDNGNGKKPHRKSLPTGKVIVEKIVRSGKKKHAEPAKAAKPSKKEKKNGKAKKTAAATRSAATLHIAAQISSESIASAARAFQLMLALQELGEIVSMQPTQEQIETAAPVAEFHAEIIPHVGRDEISRALGNISEITRLEVGGAEETLAGQTLLVNGRAVEACAAVSLEKPAAQPNVMASSGAAPKHDNNRPAPVAELARQQKTSEKTVRTSVERLDTLMNLVGELITDRNRLFMIRSGLEARHRGDEQMEYLAEAIGHVGRITDQLQSEVMSIRMLPISNVFHKFPRLVRDLGRNANKQVELVMRGEDTELDRSVIEVISDPLIHLLRNAVDHGLEIPEERRAAGKPEKGTILLTARHEQGRIIITVEDDGKGIDTQRVVAKAVEKGMLSPAEAAGLSDEESIDLIFRSGLSTAKLVSDVSGRGVGMDIVRNNIERLNGSILVETWRGRGTQFQIVLPLTLAIVPSLLVRVRQNVFAIPLVTVTETLRIKMGEIQTVNNKPVILLRDHVLPVINLGSIFGLGNIAQRDSYEYVVVVRTGKTQLGLIVDMLVGEQEVVVKSLSAIIGDISGISSAAILGDGSVALIVDVQGIFKLANMHEHKPA